MHCPLTWFWLLLVPASTSTPPNPPGTQGILTVVNYVAWGAFAACLVGFVVAAATMAWKHHRGDEAASMKGLGFSLLGTVLIGAAGAIVGSVT